MQHICCLGPWCPSTCHGISPLKMWTLMLHDELCTRALCFWPLEKLSLFLFFSLYLSLSLFLSLPPLVPQNKTCFHLGKKICDQVVGWRDIFNLDVSKMYLLNASLSLILPLQFCPWCWKTTWPLNDSSFTASLKKLYRLEPACYHQVFLLLTQPYTLNKMNKENLASVDWKQLNTVSSKEAFNPIFWTHHIIMPFCSHRTNTALQD